MNMNPPDRAGSQPGSGDPVSSGGDGHPLALTGERTLPDVADERYWFERHVVAYELAADLVGQQGAEHRMPDRVGPLTVLDAGCGEGYGLPRLRAAGGERVIGVDLDPDTVSHARGRYAATDEQVEVLQGDLTELPLADGEVAVCVSLQVIEHLDDVGRYLHELRRVTARHGTVAVSTPNRLTFTPGGDTPVNPFHVREFSPDELRAELTGAGLTVRWLAGVHHGAQLLAEQRALGVDLLGVLTTTAPQEWSPQVRALVHRVESRMFEVHDVELDASLDLIAVCGVS